MFGMSPLSSLSAPLILLSLASAFGPASLLAQPSPGDSTPGSEPPNPFAAFTTHRLANGVKVWVGRLEGAPNVSVSVNVPAGWDADPSGKEETTHFLEHVLFGDHRGKREEEIKDEVEGRGGSWNAFTTPDHTFYWVTLPREHGLFGIEWLGRILEPHELTPRVVDRHRHPVALEIGAQPRDLADWIWHHYVRPGWLRLPDFWGREFGLETRAQRSYDRWESLQAIGPEDLQSFYRRHYAPEGLTVTVVGDLDRDSAVARARDAFGGLPTREVEPWVRDLEDPGRFRREVTWSYRPDVRYRRVFKVFELDRATHLQLLFLSRYLERRLSRRLRFGERKAVYGVRVSLEIRWPAAHLELVAPMEEGEVEYALSVVEEELEVLRSAAMDSTEFARERDALARQLAAESQSAQDVGFWVHRTLYPPGLHRDFPDLVEAFRETEQEDLAALLSERLSRQRQVVFLKRKLPLGQLPLAGLGLLLAWLAVAGARRALVEPVEMTRIRYVARFQLPLPYRILVYLLLGLAGAWAGRLLVHGARRGVRAWLLPVDSWPLQWGTMGLLGMAGVALVILFLARIPRKILVFRDHVRIKFLAYRSRILRPAEIREISSRSFASVWLTRRLFRTIPLTPGILSPGLYLEPEAGPAYFFRVRAPHELARVLDGIGAPVAVEGTGVRAPESSEPDGTEAPEPPRR